MADLKHEFEFYQAHKAEYLAKHPGKVLVIKDQEVIGIYDDRLKAIQETAKTHPVGSFLVQLVSEVDEQVRFHSRLAV